MHKTIRVTPQSAPTTTITIIITVRVRKKISNNINHFIKPYKTRVSSIVQKENQTIEKYKIENKLEIWHWSYSKEVDILHRDHSKHRKMKAGRGRGGRGIGKASKKNLITTYTLGI